MTTTSSIAGASRIAYYELTNQESIIEGLVEQKKFSEIPKVVSQYIQDQTIPSYNKYQLLLWLLDQLDSFYQKEISLLMTSGNPLKCNQEQLGWIYYRLAEGYYQQERPKYSLAAENARKALEGIPRSDPAHNELVEMIRVCDSKESYRQESF